MSKLETWLNRQAPDTKKSLTPLRIADRDFLHISSNPTLGDMRPRVGERQLEGEDRTIPRICGSETVVGCIYGHSSIHHSSIDDTEEYSPVTVFHLYRLDAEEIVRPSKRLVPDVVMTKELWIVPYCPQTCKIKPSKVALLMPVKIVRTTESGVTSIVNHFYLSVRTPIKLHEKVLEPGYYSFSLSGDLTPIKGVSEPENFKTIAQTDWTTKYTALQNT